MADETASIDLKGSDEARVESSNALDDLLKSEEGAAEGDTATAEAAAKVAEEKAIAEAEAKAAEEAKSAEEKAVADAKTAEQKAADDKAAAVANKDEFDAIELPPHVKPKTVESFTNVKALARTKIAGLSETVSKLQEDLKAANEAVELAKKGEASEEVQKELEELRSFRRGLDVEADPEFKKFDAQVTANDESIYARLSKAGFNKESIDRVKALGGPGNVDWDKLSDKIPSDLKRYLDVKLVENIDLAEKKTKAVEAAKKNSAAFLKTREAEASKSDKNRSEATQKHFKEVSSGLTWLKTLEIPKTATSADRVKIEAANKAVAEINKDIADALSDDSPEMRAVLVAGYAQMLKLRHEVASEKSARKVEVETLKKQLAEKEAYIKGIQNSSTARLHSSAPDGKSAKSAKSHVNVDENPSAALDRLRDEVVAAAADKE